MQLMKLKLEEIHLNKDNPRKTAADASDNGSLIASIKAVGILQPPAVRKNGNGYVVAYGNRRVAAAKEIGLDEIQCLVVNDDNAEVSAIMENTARADMDPMDEYEAFVMLTKNGITEDDIADMFGVTVNRVRRRMALGKLHPNVRKEYRAGKLSLSDCMTLTLLSHKDQKAALDEGISIWSIKLNVFAGKISMRAAIFDHSLYTGKLTYDLFSKHMKSGEPEAFAEDIDMFLELQKKAVEDLAVEKAKEWRFAYISISDEYCLQEIDGVPLMRTYEDANPAKHGVIIHIDMNSGKVKVSEGWKKSKPEKKKAEVAELIKAESASTASLTGPQRGQLGQAYAKLFFEQATIHDLYWLIVMSSDWSYDHSKPRPSDKDLESCFRDYVMRKVGTMGPDANVCNIFDNRKIKLRDHWTPDEDFVKGYSKPQLQTLANELGSTVSESLKKSEAVSKLANDFATGKGKNWMPGKDRRFGA